MIYLLRQCDRTFTAAEHESTAARLEQKGFTRCDRAAFLAAWKERDDERAAQALKRTVS